MKISQNKGAKITKRGRLPPLFLALCLCVFAVQNIFAQPADKVDVLAKVNQARRANDLPPLAWNPMLDKAAQRHSDDMARKGFVDETGSDGSSSRQRVEAAGYGRWPGVLIWSESLYAGQTTFDEAINFLLSDEGQRRALVNPKLREVGVGVARDNLRTYWTLTFGAQPNVLPIFINEGAAVTNDRQVVVLLTQEKAVPAGDANAIGRVIQVRLSEKPDLAGSNWQPWQASIPFTLSARAGVKTLYVQMRDDAGRTTLATASIEYDPNSAASVRPVGLSVNVTLTPDPTSAPAPASASTPTPVLIPLASTTPAVNIAPAESVPSPHTPGLAVPTPTAVVIGGSVVVTVMPTQIATERGAEATNVASTASTPGVVVVMVQPTSTRMPTPATVERSVAPAIAQSPTAETGVRQFGAANPDATLPNWLIPLYLIVQTGVIVLGLIALIRKR